MKIVATEPMKFASQVIVWAPRTSMAKMIDDSKKQDPPLQRFEPPVLI
jgi:hypothetical protein